MAKRSLILVGFGLFVFVGMALFTTPYMTAATLAYMLMISGLIFKRIVKLHVFLMVLAIIIDITIVLILELSRSAIETAIQFDLSLLQQLHIGTSTVALLLYFPTWALGSLMYFGKINPFRFRKFHIRLGITAFVFRTLGFLLMFSLLEKYVK